MFFLAHFNLLDFSLQIYVFMFVLLIKLYVFCEYSFNISMSYNCLLLLPHAAVNKCSSFPIIIF